MYTAYVEAPHFTWNGFRAYDANDHSYVIDRIQFPVIASSLGHAKKLAEKAWGCGNSTARITVHYVGPCMEPAR